MCSHENACLARRRRWRWVADEQGSTTTELVVVMPLLVLLVLVITQLALWRYAATIAQAAAAQALATTRVYGGTTTAGNTEAAHVLAQLAHGPLTDTHITVTRTPQQSTVDIQGRVVSLVPLLHLTVTAQATGPSETVTGNAYGFTHSGAFSGGNRSGGGR